jgi:hypothetical protein
MSRSLLSASVKYFTVIGLNYLAACTPAAEPAQEVSSKLIPPQRELIGVHELLSDFSVESYVAISCEAYGKKFGWDRRLDITDKKVLGQISQRLQQVQAAPSGYHIDVRAKAILRYSDHSRDTLCLGNFFNHYRGQLVQADTVLSQLLGISDQAPFIDEPAHQ